MKKDKCQVCKHPIEYHLLWGGQHHKCKQGKRIVDHDGYHGYCQMLDCSCVVNAGDNRPIS